MHQTLHTGFLPAPSFIRKLVFLISFTSVIVALFSNYLPIPPEFFLALSATGLRELYFWQPFTYIFIHSMGGGIGLPMIINLFFNMFILWRLGPVVYEHVGKASFLRLFFLSALFSGMSVTVVLYFFPYPQLPLVGCSPSIYALMLVWAVLYREAEVLLFATWPLKVMNLVLALIAINVLIDISQMHFVGLLATLSGAAFGYFYALSKWSFYRPTAFTAYLVRFAVYLRSVRAFFSKRKASNIEKIFDFQTGHSIADDELFLDQVLEKISKEGQAALSAGEKKRLDQISSRKRQGN